MARWFWFSLAVLAATSVSAAPLAGFVPRGETPRFVFYAQGDAGNLEPEKCEAYLERVEKLLGHRVEGQRAYYVVGHASDIARATGRYTSGVTYPGSGVILSVHGFHAHEIVHRVAFELGDPGLFFQEGLAVTIADEGKVEGKNVDKLARQALKRTSVAAQVKRFEPTSEGYALAGSFVRFLAREHGLPRVTQLFREHGRAGSLDEQVFSRVFGATLESELERWQAAL